MSLDTTSTASVPNAVPAALTLPRLRIQNANAISSPLTWGFPAITAFTGLMAALERRLGQGAGIEFLGVGVVCHGFEAQATQGGFTRAFHLTRNPVLADGSTAAIVEEGRVHLDLTLVFEVQIDPSHRGEAEQQSLANRVADTLAGMRVAGGSVMPPLVHAARRRNQPTLELLAAQEEQEKQFRRWARRWLPGFALVSRDDLLQSRWAEMKDADPNANLLDAWLDLSRWNQRAVARQPAKVRDAPPGEADWVSDMRDGWLVPMPVGFASLSDLHASGTVSGARDMATPLRFVETVWSMGQWISPHRLRRMADLVWYPEHDFGAGPGSVYRCRNDHTPTTAPATSHAAMSQQD